MAKRIYWKIIRKEDRLSMIALSYGRPLPNVKYHINRWVAPFIPNSKLMVFSSKYMAERYILDKFEPEKERYIIVRCYIKGKKTKNIVLLNWKICSIKEILNHWNNPTYYGGYKWETPPGTIFASEVYCLE